MSAALIDTCFYTTFASGEENTIQLMSEFDCLLISGFVLAELYYGFRKGSKIKENYNFLKEFLNHPQVITKTIFSTNETSEYFAKIKLELQRKGQPIPINDVWIAAQTMEHGSVLLTHDSHFKHISGLRLGI